MLSLDNAFRDDEVRDFDRRIHERLSLTGAYATRPSRNWMAWRSARATKMAPLCRVRHAATVKQARISPELEDHQGAAAQVARRHGTARA